MNEKKSVDRSDSVFVDEEERSRREVVNSDADERSRSSWRRSTASACREEVTIAVSASRSALEVVESTESVDRRMRLCWARIWVENQQRSGEEMKDERRAGVLSTLTDERGNMGSNEAAAWRMVGG